MADPPLAPAVKDAVTRALPAVTEVKVGAEGATAGVELIATDSAESPEAVTALSFIG
jgi:hypothetical protein